jgi:hypothetical protein
MKTSKECPILLHQSQLSADFNHFRDFVEYQRGHLNFVVFCAYGKGESHFHLSGRSHNRPLNRHGLGDPMNGHIARCSYRISTRLTDVYGFGDFTSKLCRRVALALQVVLVEVLLHKFVGKLEIGDLHLNRQVACTYVENGTSLFVECLDIKRRGFGKKGHLPYRRSVQGLTK